jgi:uncharacterized protein (DUF2344 family)
MKIRNVILSSALVLGLAAGGLTIAQGVNPHRHPNLAAAQELMDKAATKITDAQVANEWDMEGHAAKAKELLDQARHEIKLAAEAANEHHK